MRKKMGLVDLTVRLTIDKLVPGEKYSFWYDMYQFRLNMMQEKHPHLLMVPVKGIPTVFSNITPVGVPNQWGDNGTGFLGVFTKEDILDAGPIDIRKYSQWLFTKEERLLIIKSDVLNSVRRSGAYRIKSWKKAWGAINRR